MANPGGTSGQAAGTKDSICWDVGTNALQKSVGPSVEIHMIENINTSTTTLTAPRHSLATITATQVIDLVVRPEPRVQLEWDEETGSYRLGISL